MRNKRKTREEKEVFSTSTTPTANCHADANGTTADASVCFFALKVLIKVDWRCHATCSRRNRCIVVGFFFSPSLAPSNQREVSREL